MDISADFVKNRIAQLHRERAELSNRLAGIEIAVHELESLLAMTQSGTNPSPTQGDSVGGASITSFHLPSVPPSGSVIQPTTPSDGVVLSPKTKTPVLTPEQTLRSAVRMKTRV